MANIPENSSYQSANTPAITTGGFSYTPKTNYQNLGKFPTAATPVAGTPAYDITKQKSISDYGSLLNGGKGVSTQTQFLPPEGDIATPISIPSDYGTFATPGKVTDNGLNLSWGTPTSPVIKNIAGDVSGQYVEDTANPELLAKTVRGSNPASDDAIRSGRSGSMYVIDHIMPLSLGGADTLANRQLLTSDQNIIKTKAQSVPYTLYAYGDISLTQAREMAMKWKDRDLSDVPVPNDYGLVADTKGKTGIEIARETAKVWEQPKQETLKEKIGKIPELAKDFGEGWLPDPARELTKGLASGLTLGFVPYEQDDNETAGSDLAGKAGLILGGVASFLIGDVIIMGALKGIGLGLAALNAARGVTVAKVIEAGLGGAKAVETGAKVAEGLKTSGTTFKTLNKVPGYLEEVLSPKGLAKMGRMATTSAVVGQASRFIQNDFNPNTISEKAFSTDQENTIGNIVGDLALGAVSGVGSPTIKGTAVAIAPPLFLGLINNPDDPMEAITDAAMFGALHLTMSKSNPQFNDVKLFGGKPYESPITGQFNNVLNEASYKSLSYYAPETLSGFKPGDKIPEAVIQKAKNEAVIEVWSRFLNGKDITAEAKNKALADLKSFSTGLNAGLDTKFKEPTTSWLSGLLHPSAKKAETAKVKSQNANISETYGKDYQSRNKVVGDLSKLPDTGMDLQTALTEVKRITIAARQLYKGGLSAEMRGKADLDDILSYSKTQLDNRFHSQEKFLPNPPIASQAVNLMDDSFMTNSFKNERPTPSGQFPNGTIAMSGAGLDVNSPRVVSFLEQKRIGNASPNLLIVDRSDTASLWRMLNGLLDAKDIKLNKKAINKNPENALQVFGIQWKTDPATGKRTGGKELVELDWVATEHRRESGENAFNKHPGVQEWRDSGGAKGMKPLDFNKDDISVAMKENNIPVLVSNFDVLTTPATKESGNPFIVANVNDSNWNYSKSLGDRLSQQGNSNPISMDIAKVNNALNPQQKEIAIADMKSKQVKPVSEYLPKPALTIGKDSKAIAPQEKTIEVVQTMEKALDANSPAVVKENFKNSFGILLDDAQARDMFTRKNDITMREGVNILVKAINEGDVSTATRLKLDFVKTYLESGVLSYSENGNAVLDMNILGKKNPMVTGIEEHVAPVAENTQSAITEPQSVSSPDAASSLHAKLPENTQSTVTPSEPSSGLADRISEVVKKEPIAVTKKEVEVLPFKQDPSIESGRLTSEEEVRQDTRADEGEQHYSSQDVTPEDFASKQWKSLNGGNIPEKRSERGDLIRKIAVEMEDNFSMQYEQALSTTKKLLPELSGMDDNFKRTPFTKPGSLPGEYGNWIKKGLATSVTENPRAHYMAKAFDKGLQDMLGPDYNKIPKLASVLDDYFKNIFFNDKNNVGKEITQPKDVLNAMARGDKVSMGKAMEARRELLKKNPTGEGSTEAERASVAQKGLGPEDFSGEGEFSVTPWYQEDNMVKDLTYGENLMGGLFSDVPQGAATVTRAVRTLFLGDGKGNGGLRNYILQRIPSAKRSIRLDNMVEEAVKVDNQNATRTKAEKDLVTKAKDTVPNLIRQMEVIKKAIDNPEERANWETPEILKELEESTKADLEKYSNLLKNYKSDGKGGPGDVLNNIKKTTTSVADNLWNDLRNPKHSEGYNNLQSSISSTWKNLTSGFTPKKESVPQSPARTPLDVDKFMMAIGENETNIVPGNVYASFQPSGSKALGKALGKYRITEGDLKAYSKRYLGRDVTAKEFLSNPDLQDLYLKNKALYLYNQGYEAQDIADIHNKGMTNSFPAGSGQYQNPDYVEKFNANYNSN